MGTCFKIVKKQPKKHVEWLYAAHPLQSESPEAQADIIYVLFKEAAKLKLLACCPSEVGARA